MIRYSMKVERTANGDSATSSRIREQGEEEQFSFPDL